MTRAIAGLHHVTAISGPPQPHVDFYAGALGQRLVKRTVNFDDPGTYHLYYGNRAAEPGSIFTVFPFAGAAPGRAGPGMASAFAYAVGDAVMDDVVEGLRGCGAAVSEPEERFGARVATVTDPDGAPVELATVPGAGGVGEDGFHSVTLLLRDPEPTRRLLVDVMGYEDAGHAREAGGERLRLRTPGGARGAVVDLLRRDGAGAGRQGRGSIHHVAFRAADGAEQAEWRERLLAAGMDVTPVIDRQYFDAIYFREPGGVLFEIATDPPGFAVDEPMDHLGERLMLPERYEPIRSRIEAVLPEIRT
ncbi:ring-cleaving dioxygenase [Jannaschia sp. W003]|uniref:ring-cleaving dioxygenase n=1 Tax=Jannaschia sp. W003 TaxID=2867012 RepID=UPI0021A47E56|nr:ring-cleaving dioxygenase [Jannaschia sp. W003]UWQ21333.1 ring-cleaving dioxygenase [Jannaschia sp. W003]